MKVNDLLYSITEKLELSQTQLDRIEKSYNAVGNWLNESYEISKYGKILIFPQGSVGLGTVVKPIDKDYDIDLVIRLDNKNITAEILKKLVGKRLQENDIYKNMLDKEGKRCWTLIYSDSLNYHMDILPTKIDSNPVSYNGIPSIQATNKDEHGIYSFKSTNPSGYLNWFLSKAGRIQLRDSFEIKPLNQYPLKNVLQKIVQLLKRHRDVYFYKRKIKEDLPISIIITTLAARAYNGENDLFEGLKNVSMKMNDYIVKNNGINYIVNPVDSKENFAERWNSSNNKEKNYYLWNDQLNKDLNRIEKASFVELASLLKGCFGETVVNSVYDSIGERFKASRETGTLRMNIETGTLNEEKGEVVKPHTFYGK